MKNVIDITDIIVGYFSFIAYKYELILLLSNSAGFNLNRIFAFGSSYSRNVLDSNPGPPQIFNHVLLFKKSICNTYT